MDIVYPLGTGSLWGKNKELRYSLRSIEKYLTGVDQIFIVGEIPEWVQNVFHIPCGDNNGVNKDKNIFDKILAACEDPRVSDDFLFINDDHFQLQPMCLTQYPFYYWNSLREKKDLTPDTEYYKRTLGNTLYALKKRSLPTKHFDIHTPVIYNKIQFAKIVSSFDWRREWGYCIKSLYCNSLMIPGELLPDCKINDWMTRSQIEATVAGRPCFSINDRALVEDMRNFLADRFPEKSKYEQ